jgi:hypothetical protein
MVCPVDTSSYEERHLRASQTIPVRRHWILEDDEFAQAGIMVDR